MESARKRQKLSLDTASSISMSDEQEGESTDFKLAILASLYPDRSQDVLLDYLLAYNGSVDEVGNALSAPAKPETPRKSSAASGTGYQSSLSSFATRTNVASAIARPSLTRKGHTLHLYVRRDAPTELYTLINPVTRRRRKTHAMLNCPKLPPH